MTNAVLHYKHIYTAMRVERGLVVALAVAVGLALGVEATDFDISDAKKEQLVEAGRGFTEDYLEWYNNDEEKANK